MNRFGNYLQLIGPAAFVSESGERVLLSPTQRAIVLRLVILSPKIVEWQTLASAVWGENQPVSARAAIQNQISRLRASCGEDIIETIGEGYLLNVATDLSILRKITTTAQAASAEKTFLDLDELLGENIVEVLLGADKTPDVVALQDNSTATLEAAISTRFEMALLSDRWAWALIEGKRLALQYPTDEKIIANYARALAKAGRRGDALATLAQLRNTLKQELGIKPGSDFKSAETEILLGSSSTTSASGERITERPLVTKFFGRDKELRQTLRTVATKRAAQVVGEYGSGVSRLLAEARARLAALGVRTYFVRAAEHPPSATSLIEELLSDMSVTKDASQTSLTAFAAAVEAVTAATPTVFIVDDAHYLGATGWQALRIIENSANCGLIIGAHRSVAHLLSGDEIKLEPLDSLISEQILKAYGLSDPQRIEQMVKSSGGNPLALELLSRDNSNKAPADDTEKGSYASQQSQFTYFLRRIINELSADELQDLQLATIAGDGYPLKALQLVDRIHPAQLPEALVQVDDDGLLRFRYGGLQPYLYNTVSKGFLLDQHYALGAAAAKAEASAATAARHLMAASELDPEGAIAAARDAANESTKLGAHADAAGWFTNALTVAKKFGLDTAELSIQHANALRLAGDPQHLTLLILAVENALKTGDEDLISSAGFALLQLGASSPAGELRPELNTLIDRMLAAVKDPQLRAPLEAAASLSWSMTGNAEKARTLFDRAEANAATINARLAVLPFAYLAVGRPQDLERREALANELLTLARKTELLEAEWEGLHLSFSVALQRANGKMVRQILREMESMIDSIGDVGRRWSTQYCAATVAQLNGDLEDSENLAAAAYKTFANVSPDRATAAYYAQILGLRITQNRVAELTPTITELVESQPGVTAWNSATALAIATEFNIARERGADSKELAEKQRSGIAMAKLALETAQDDFTWLATHMIGGKAAALLGQPSLIDTYIERLEPWSHLVCWQGVCSYGPVAEVLAELFAAKGEPVASQHYGEQAKELNRRLSEAR